MPTILVDLSSDGKYHVDVTNEELEVLKELETNWGTIHDAMNHIPADSDEVKLCHNIMNRPHQRILQFTFYC